MFRKEHCQFVAEGDRLVQDLLNSSLEVIALYHLEGWNPKSSTKRITLQQVSYKEMERISGLSTPSDVLAVAKLPNREVCLNLKIDELVLILDEIQDPGNMGTIIRLADWFGIEQVICSEGTVDAYAPKVIQATMGSIARVKITYHSVFDIVEQLIQNGIAVYGTYLEGEDIFHSKLTQNGAIVLGNEGNGISKRLESIIQHRLTIPRFSKVNSGSESLNVALAAAIVCGEFRKRIMV
jgi:TrmH family RNA methyltransferase